MPSTIVVSLFYNLEQKNQYKKVPYYVWHVAGVAVLVKAGDFHQILNVLSEHAEMCETNLFQIFAG